MNLNSLIMPSRPVTKQRKSSLATITILSLVTVAFVLLIAERLQWGYDDNDDNSSRVLDVILNPFKKKMITNIMKKQIFKDHTDTNRLFIPKQQILNRDQIIKGTARANHLVWCMGYPQGGAEHLLRLVEHATGLGMASNYGDEVYTMNGTMHIRKFFSRKIENWNHKLKLGPFVNNAELTTLPRERLLVRTHCSGTCLYEPHISCDANEYTAAINSEFRTFRMSCTHGKNYGSRMKKIYGETMVHDAVLVVRDPKEVIDARFKNYVELYGKYTYNATDIIQFCLDTDRAHANYDVFTDIREGPVTSRFFLNGGTVPCYTEIYRILTWYSKAVTTARKKRDSIIFHWDNFADVTKREKAGEKLLSFLNLQKNKTEDDFVFDNPPVLTINEDIKDLMQSFINAVMPENVKSFFYDPVELDWNKMKGRATKLAIDYAGENVWLITMSRRRSGTYYRTNGTNRGGWTKIKNRFRQVAVDRAGTNVWAIGHTIVRKKVPGRRKKKRIKVYHAYNKKAGETTFTKISSGIDYVAVDGQGNVWSIGAGKIYYSPSSASGFENVEGPSLATIAVSGDGQHIWGTDSSYNIFYKAGYAGEWTEVDGSMKELSVTDDGSTVIGTDANKNAYYRRGFAGSWINILGQYDNVVISGNGETVWGTVRKRNYMLYASFE